MDRMYQVLMILVGTLCLTILIGLVGVFYGKVDAQFIEGLVSGALVTLITMLIKDILNEPSPNTVTTSATVQPIASAIIEPKKAISDEIKPIVQAITESPKTGV